MASRNNWKAQIKQIVEEPAGPGGQNLLLETIKEFVATLSGSRWLHAELEQDSTSSLRSIVLTPKTRRNERNVILSLWVTPYSVSVIGDKNKEYDDPKSLQQFFVEFAKRSNLSRMTEEYRKRCLLPVLGTLRTSYSVPYGTDDITVLIDPLEQEKLLEAADGDRPGVVTITATPAEGGNHIVEQVEYRFLDSAGLSLALTGEPRRNDDGSIRLTGTAFLGRGGTPPLRLVANTGKCAEGSMVLGMGFLLSPEEAEQLIKISLSNQEVISPYLNGDDLNNRPDQSAARFVIDFRDWPLDRAEAPSGYQGHVAADFPDVLRWLEMHAKQERLSKPGPVASAPWWQFWRRRTRLYDAISGLRRVLVRARLSKYNCVAFVEYHPVFSEQVVVFALEDWSSFAVLQSFAHNEWSAHNAPMLGFRSAVRYVPLDCFETFTFPSSNSALGSIGESYHEHRKRIMHDRREGLTKTYNRFHMQDNIAADVQMLRSLHVQMDECVALAYGWDDLRLDHGFHATQQGQRFTISETARSEVIARLLRLNHQCYAEEVAEGLHETRKTRKQLASKKKKRGTSDRG
ncbi:hypothetical protein [Sorangium sp. So ce1153]|uniref:hypothetical protein n=1 Tax=Sorangium sp. So ce1153 TaxID=3133333 RepID=UPI003F6045EA